jgi:hypothetical protein
MEWFIVGVSYCGKALRQMISLLKLSIAEPLHETGDQEIFTDTR